MFYQLHHIGSSEYLKREENENFSYPPHMHQCFELITVTSGEMNVLIGGNQYTVKPNELILIFPNQLHSLDSTESKHLLFIFSPKLVQAFFVKYSNKIPKNPKFRVNEYISDALKSLDTDKSTISAKGILYSVCAALEEQSGFISSAETKEDLLMKIFDFVDKNFAKNCALTDIAKALGYDHAYISRYFKKASGISYNNYVNITRLNHASYLLKNTNLPILECSIECGYRSLRSFNRNFKEYFALTPSEYKNS